jgi:hypothetical protein
MSKKNTKKIHPEIIHSEIIYTKSKPNPSNNTKKLFPKPNIRTKTISKTISNIIEQLFSLKKNKVEPSNNKTLSIKESPKTTTAKKDSPKTKTAKKDSPKTTTAKKDSPKKQSSKKQSSKKRSSPSSSPEQSEPPTASPTKETKETIVSIPLISSSLPPPPPDYIPPYSYASRKKPNVTKKT